MDPIEQELQKKYGKADPIIAELQNRYGGKPAVKTRSQSLDDKSARENRALFPNITGGESVLSAGGKAVGNMPGSALNTALSLLKVGGSFLLYDNPVSKLLGIGEEKSVTKNLSDAMKGGIAKATGMTGGNERETETFNAFSEALKERYGSLENLQRTLVNDPFGAGLDIYGALEGVAGVAGKTSALRNAASKTGSLPADAAKGVGEAIGKTGAKIKETATNVVTPMQEGVVTALKETGAKLTDTGVTKFDEYLDQAKKAATDFHLPTALEVAGQKADDALNVMRQIMKKAGEQKRTVTESMTYKPVGSIVNEAIDELKINIRERIGATFKSDGSFGNMPGRTIAVSDPADMTILDVTMRKLSEAAKNPTFRRVDDTIDYLQDLLYKRKSNLAVPINSKVEGVIKSTIGKLNEQLKTIGGAEYKAYNSVISETKGIFDDLNKALGKDASKGGSLMKRVFSPTDGGTKKLFEKIKGLTGIDLVDEATLAKLAMEIVGDTRQANLLEQLGLIIKPSASSAVMEAGKWVLKKLQDTESKAKSIINKAREK